MTMTMPSIGRTSSQGLREGPRPVEISSEGYCYEDRIQHLSRCRRRDPHFAVKQTVNGISLSMVGITLMASGALGLILELAMFAARRRETVVRTTSVTGSNGVGGRGQVATGPVSEIVTRKTRDPQI